MSPTPGSISLVLDADGSTNPDFDLLKISSSLEIDSLNLFFLKELSIKLKFSRQSQLHQDLKISLSNSRVLIRCLDVIKEPSDPNSFSKKAIISSLSVITRPLNSIAGNFPDLTFQGTNFLFDRSKTYLFF